MKRLLALLFVFAFATACTKDEPKPESDPGTTAAPAASVAATVEPVRSTTYGTVPDLRHRGANPKESRLTHLADLTEIVSAPKPREGELLHQITVEVASAGNARVAGPAVKAPWIGFTLPGAQGVTAAGTDSVSYVEHRLRLNLSSSSVRAQVGHRLFDDYASLRDYVRTTKASSADAPSPGYILEARHGVPARFVVAALAVLLEEGLPAKLAAPDLVLEAEPHESLQAVKEAIALAASEAPKDSGGLPRLGVRIRPDASAAWAEVARVIGYSAQAGVSRITLTALHGNVEFDLAPAPGTGEASGEPSVLLPLLEKKEVEYDPTAKRSLHKAPTIDHEAAVERAIGELEEDVDELSGKNLDSTAVVDAVGVGGGADGPYGSRWGKDSLTTTGGNEGTEVAVAGALHWLARHQATDGHWGAEDFSERCNDKACSGPDQRSRSGLGPGTGDARYDVGVTGLALLAFLGNGHTHKASPVPEFRAVVNKAIRFLRKKQTSDGSVGFTMGDDVYNHAIATMALCEAYTLSKDFTLKRPCQKAVDWLVKAQNPDLGWKYGVRMGKNDTSVTGWAVLALAAARTAELEVPEESFKGALHWFERATSNGGRGKAPGLVGYERPADGGSMLNPEALEGHLGYKPKLTLSFEGAPTMTAVAVLGRVLCGQDRRHERIQQGLKILSANPPRWDGPDKTTKNQNSFYYWYHGTYAVFQASRTGSSEWQKWNQGAA